MTYCGKNCEECAYREGPGCNGCTLTCEIGLCCQGSGHATCATCLRRDTCPTLRGSSDAPERRLKALAEAEQKRAETARRAPILGKWLWVLFWVVIAANVLDLLTIKEGTALYSLGQAGKWACSAGAGAILLGLGGEHPGYRTAGLCSLGALALSIAAKLAGGTEADWTLILTLPAAIVSLYGQYEEYYHAHPEMLSGVNGELSEKWQTLWWWNIGTFVITLSGTLLVLISMVLAALVVVAGAIATLVVGIMKIVYLYRMAKFFREYSPEPQEQ